MNKSPNLKQMQEKLENMPLQLTTRSPVWSFDENRLALMDRLMMNLAFAVNCEAYRSVNQTRFHSRPRATAYTVSYTFIGESMKNPGMSKLLRDFMDRIYTSQFAASKLGQIESTINHQRADSGERVITWGSGIASPRDYNHHNPLPTVAWSYTRHGVKRLIKKAFGPMTINVEERVRKLPSDFGPPQERQFLVLTVRRKDYGKNGKPFDEKQLSKSKEVVDHLLALGFQGVRRKYVTMRGGIRSPHLGMMCDSIRYEFPIDSNLNLLNWREFHIRMARRVDADSLI